MDWDKGFTSPFKSDAVFLSFKEQQGLKWGTGQAITVRDAEFGALRLRAFGSYSFRIAGIDTFVARVVGTLEGVTDRGGGRHPDRCRLRLLLARAARME